MPKSPIHELEWRERRSRWFVALAVLLSIAVLASTWVALFSFLGVNTAYGVFQGLEEKYLPDMASMDLGSPRPLAGITHLQRRRDLALAQLHDGRFSASRSVTGDVPKRVVMPCSHQRMAASSSMRGSTGAVWAGRCSKT